MHNASLRDVFSTHGVVIEEEHLPILTEEDFGQLFCLVLKYLIFTHRARRKYSVRTEFVEYMTRVESIHKCTCICRGTDDVTLHPRDPADSATNPLVLLGGTIRVPHVTKVKVKQSVGVSRKHIIDAPVQVIEVNRLHMRYVVA